jgi:hypothetical protein
MALVLEWNAIYSIEMPCNHAKLVIWSCSTGFEAESNLVEEKEDVLETGEVSKRRIGWPATRVAGTPVAWRSTVLLSPLFISSSSPLVRPLADCLSHHR